MFQLSFFFLIRGFGELFFFLFLPFFLSCLFLILENRWKGTDDYLFFAGCFDETVYIHCALNIFFVSGPFEFVWSTMAKPVRTLITDIHPTSLTLNQGLIAASGLIQGFLLFL